MEVKKNLNNVQRKMLDQIYTEQFEKIAGAIKQDRTDGLKKLEAKLLAKIASNKDVKKMMEAGRTFYQLHDQLKGGLAENSVSVDSTLLRAPRLTIGSRYYGSSYGEFPEVAEYNAETRRIELNLAEKKKEMRAKIYGVAASYEDVDKEITELLKDV